MGNDKKMMIKKHSAMIQISVKELTLIQRKLINSLIHVAQKVGVATMYKTQLSVLKECCNITSMGNEQIKEQLKDLKEINFVFNYLNKDKTEVWKTFDLLSEVAIYPNTGIVEFAFPPTMMEKVINPQMYAPIDIFLVAGLKCSYSIVIYEFLRDYLTAPVVPKLSIEDLRNLLGIKNHEYKFFPNFKRKVLDTCIKEINEKSDIICHYELIKEYRNRYSHIQFLVSKKQELSLLKNFEENTLNLFEDNQNEENIIIPQEIIAVIPENQRTKVITEQLIKYLDKGNEYIISNIKYSLEKAKDNFPAYLRQALEKDYASHEREVETNIKIKKEKVIKNKVEAQTKTTKEREKMEKMLALTKQLPEVEREKLKARAINIIKLESPGNEFALSELLVGLKMANLYMNDHEIEKYSSSDQD